MNLIYFTEEAYKLLKKDLNLNIDKYFCDEPWLDEYFSSNGLNEFYKTSSITVPNIELVYSGDDDESKKIDDLTNIKLFYAEYKDKLTPLQASDPLIWSALCHISFRQYILKRWAKKGTDDASIGSRFFAISGRSSLAYYNAISRLWWSGYLTYDENRKSTNPWHLTEILLSAQQIQKDLIDSPFCMNKIIVTGLLSALKRIQSERGNAATKVFRDCCNSYLNHYGTITILDALTADDIEELAYSFMKNTPQKSS